MEKNPRMVLLTICSVVVLVIRSCCDASLGHCDSSGFITFNCSGVGLSAIPTLKDVPSYYQVLDFSNNHISNISHLDFAQGNNITALFLNNNKIRTIESKAFEVMIKLHTLDLSGNILDGHNIKERQFDDLRQLTFLTLERNPLHVILEETFTFTELFNLKHLDLSHCAISEIKKRAIDLSFLEYLDLSWNDLKTFRKDYFRGEGLKTLDLSHNYLTAVDQLPYMPELKVWILDNNRINNITIGSAVSHLAYNLEHLYIRNNKIERFTKESFSWNLDNLQGIHLDNNPIECDCRMKWAVQDATIRDKNFTIICDSPSEHRGKNLLQIPAEDLKCGIQFSKTLQLIGVIGVSLIVVSCFMGMVLWIAKRKKGKNEKNSSRKLTQTKKRVNGADYTAVFSKEDDDVRIHVSDRTELLDEKVEEINELDITHD